MAFRERNVLGTVVDGDGSPITDGKIKFVPSESIGLTATHVVIDREIIIATGADGTFTASLWCDEDSSVAINWSVTFPVTNNGEPKPKHLKQFSTAFGDGSDIYIGTLIALGIPAPDDTTLLYAAVYGYILTLIADGTIPNREGGGGGAMSLDGLSDVVITTPANDDLLQRKAGSFVNRTLAQVKNDLGINFTVEDKANKNQANGYAGLDSNGKVAAAQLPSYVDDILEFTTVAALPAIGETGKIYVITTGADANKGVSLERVYLCRISGESGFNRCAN